MSNTIEQIAGIKIKTQEQIDGIRKSSRLAAKSLDFIRPFVVEGVTTLSLNDRLDKFIRDNGGYAACLGYKNFPKSVCISINEVVCHGIPSERVLQNGDIVNIDVVTFLDGFFGDTSMMYTVGDVSEAALKLIEITKQALDIGISQVFPDNRFGNIGYHINKFVREQKHSVVNQFVGHGVGLAMHEEPQVYHVGKKNTGPVMLPGMIFTIEPMVNQGTPNCVINEQDRWTVTTEDGKLSAQLEHTLLVTETGCEILSLGETHEDAALPD